MFFLFLFQSVIFSQAKKGEVLGINYGKIETQSLLSNQSLQYNATNVGASPNSIVFIKQIGDYNSSNFIVTSVKNKFDLNQIGNNNKVDVVNKAQTVTQNILQNGYNNIIFDYGGLSEHAVSMEFVQKGNNQSIHSYGTNSLSKDMKISQTGNGSSVIIVNLK